jgi:hypothetical protein
MLDGFDESLIIKFFGGTVQQSDPPPPQAIVDLEVLLPSLGRVQAGCADITSGKGIYLVFHQGN